ncbi:hypothetical protein [Acinetobacter baumannii]|uniref:hypothetical protein n=1 Tax=Acinetobacter baumannii TaxID=470 RepID=UPI003891CC09
MVQVSLMANNASKNNTVDINIGQTKNIVVDPKVIAKIDINPEKIRPLAKVVIASSSDLPVQRLS